jgi:hypothetical protein
MKEEKRRQETKIRSRKQYGVEVYEKTTEKG